MTWVREDDAMPWHPKIAPLSDAAFRLRSEAKCWSSAQLTDGIIRAAVLPAVSPSGKGQPRWATELVTAGIWHTAAELATQPCPHSLGDKPTCPPAGPDGWVIHDYLEYNPSAQHVVQDRAAKAERTRRWREAKTKRGASRDGDVTHHNLDTYQVGDPSRDASPNGHNPITNPVTEIIGDASRDAPVTSPRRDAPVSSPRPRPRPEGRRGGGPPRSATGRQHADGATGGEQQTSNPATAIRCRNCGNTLESAYHRNTCTKTDIEDQSDVIRQGDP